MTFDDQQLPRGFGRVILLVVASLLALVLPIVAVNQLFGTGDGTTGAPTATQSKATSPATSAAPVAPSQAAQPPAASSAELRAAQEACRLANLRQQAPLSAADVSLAQFEKHIDAMNLLVAGKISLSVATTYWEQTRIGAAQNAEAFRNADKNLAASGSRCPALDPAVANASPYGQVVAITSCSKAISGRAAALAAARKAESTWEHHIHDMELLRMGHLTPAQATAAWRKNWKIGERQLQAYQSALKNANQTTCALT